MNHVNEIAIMLGVSVGEKFEIIHRIGSNNKLLCKYYFDEERGLMVDNGNKYDDEQAEGPILNDLISGRTYTRKVPWKPRENEIFFL